MKKADVIAALGGSNNKTSKNIGLTRQAVDKWGEIIPICWALKLDKDPSNDLVFDKRHYQ